MFLAPILLAFAAAPAAAPAFVCPAPAPQDEVNAAGDPLILVDKMAAIINDNVLTFREVQIETKRFAKSRGLSEDTPGLMLAVARNQLIDMLFGEGFRQSGLDESLINQIVEDELQRKMDQAGSPAAFAVYLEEQGTTLEQERRKTLQTLIGMFYQQAELGRAPQLGSKAYRAFLSVAPSEIRNYYAENTAKYTSPRLVNARILMVQNDSVEDAEKLILDLRSQITDSTSFADMASEHSYFRRDEGSLTGEIEVDKQNYAAPLKDFLNEAESGDFSEPIELYTSWALVHIISVTEQKVLTVGEAHAMIEKDLLQRKQGLALQAAIDRLRKRCYIWLTPDLEGVFIDVYGVNPIDEEEL